MTGGRFGPGGRRRRTLGEAGQQGENENRHQDVDGHGDPQGLPHSQGGYQDKAAQGGAQQGPEGIQRIQASDGKAQRFFLSNRPGAEDGQGSPHAGRRHDQDEGDQQKLHQGKAEKIPVKLLPEDLIDRDQAAEYQRNGQGVQADNPLQKTVKQQRPFLPVHDAAEEEAAQGQPAHEGRQDRADGQGGGAEDQDQHPQPQDFVEQTAEPGKKETEQYNRTGQNYTPYLGV